MSTHPRGSLYIHLWSTQSRWEWCVNDDPGCESFPDAYGSAPDYDAAAHAAWLAYDKLVAK